MLKACCAFAKQHRKWNSALNTDKQIVHLGHVCSNYGPDELVGDVV